RRVMAAWAGGDSAETLVRTCAGGDDGWAESIPPPGIDHHPTATIPSTTASPPAPTPPWVIFFRPFPPRAFPPIGVAGGRLRALADDLMLGERESRSRRGVQLPIEERAERDVILSRARSAGALIYADAAHDLLPERVRYGIRGRRTAERVAG